MGKNLKINILLAIIFFGMYSVAIGQKHPSLVFVDSAWAKNSVNAVAYRHNALTTFKNTQYIAFYNSRQEVVLGKRKTGSARWELHVTQFKGKASDAHNSISIAVDGSGYLHVSWDHHANPLRYARTVSPGSLELSEKMPMTGVKEGKVTYPDFYTMPNGDLLFFHRDGSSGNGNLRVKRYHHDQRKWHDVQNNLIDGEGLRNAYSQISVDRFGTIHMTWVWRETGNVATNHDICYAKSNDGGITWIKSTGEKYNMPINEATAEYVVRIPQNSEMINPPAITSDENGRPYIATYWRTADSKVPQYRLLYFTGDRWITQQITNRTTPFTLSGGGTKRIPISRPQIIVTAKANKIRALLIYRDVERGSKASVAISDDLTSGTWRMKDLTAGSLDQWEPNYDYELWRKKGILSLFIQNVEQGDGETLKEIPSQPVSVLQWKPGWK